MSFIKSLLTVTVFTFFANASYAKAYTQLIPAKEAESQISYMQPLIGDWNCKRQVIQADGSWQIPKQISRWEWRYILNGHAIQDYWYPDANQLDGPGAGTNVRVFDPVTKTWKMSWTTDKLARFQTFDATFDGKLLVMQGVYPKTAQQAAYKSKITFHNISEKHFDWKFETSAITDGKKWQEVFRLNCDKI